MSVPTVAVVIGTRPEAIKMAPVVLELRRHAAACRTLVVATAQHRDMLDQALQLFEITPDVDLDVMRAGQGLGELTARLLPPLEALWRRTQPAVVLVQGDTTSSLVAALAAYYCRIPIGHVEAGLRTRDKYAPFPEEMNRRLIDAMADYLFAPTRSSRQHLLDEGVPPERIDVTGNTGIDALLFTLQRIRSNGFTPTGLAPAVFRREKLIVVTGHRRENFGDGLQQICAALRAIGESRADTTIVYAVHPNPHVTGPVRRLLGGLDNVILTPPLDYRTFVYAMDKSDLILTDSGGIQEEIACLGKPILVMRDATERMEAVDAGISELVGTDTARIINRVGEWLDHPKPLPSAVGLFGDGQAAVRIVDTLRRVLAP